MSRWQLGKARIIPEGVNAIDDLWKIFLLVQVREFKDEALGGCELEDIDNEEGRTYLGETNLANKDEEIVDVVGVSKIQLGRL